MDIEMIVMEMVVNSGNARSTAIEALRSARDGEFDKADKMLEEADQILLKSHEVQTELIQQELNGKPVPMSLLMVHSQDHLMNAMTVIDLVKELVEIERMRKS